MNLADPFHHNARCRPEAVAVIEEDRTLSFHDLEAATLHAEAALAAAGTCSGMRVGVSIGGSTAMQLTVMLALLRLGAVQLMLPTREPRAVREKILERFPVPLCIADHRALPAGLRVVAPDPTWLTSGPRRTTPGPGFAGGAAPWMIVLSSGSTGRPKALEVSHAMDFARNASQPAFACPVTGERYLGLTPMDSRVGRSAALRYLGFGAAIVAPPSTPDPDAALAAIERARPHFLFATPSQLAELMPLIPSGPPRFPAMRVRTTSAHMPPELLATVRQRLTPAIYVDYGVNDAGTLAIATVEDLDRHPGTAGKCLAGLELQIVDDGHRPVAAGTAGHLRVRGPGVGRCYIDDPDANDRAFRDGWLYPGDIATLDAQGLLFVHRRSDDLISFGGIKVTSREIEVTLLAHSAVSDCVAFALPSPSFGSIPAAAVVLRAGSDGGSLVAHCRERLGSRRPRYILTLDRLPRNALGKISRERLIHMIETRRSGQVLRPPAPPSPG